LRRVAERDRSGHAVDADGPSFELELDARTDERDLVLRVAGVREAELEQVLVDERAGRPGEDLHALETTTGVGHHDITALATRRRPEADAGERSGIDAERRPAFTGSLVGLERSVGPVEPQQVLALDVEHEDAEVRRRGAHDLGT